MKLSLLALAFLGISCSIQADIGDVLAAPVRAAGEVVEGATRAAGDIAEGTASAIAGGPYYYDEPSYAHPYFGPYYGYYGRPYYRHVYYY